MFVLAVGRGAEVPDRDSSVSAILDHSLVVATSQSARSDVLLAWSNLLRQDSRGLQLDPVPSVRSSRCASVHFRSSPSGHCLEYAWLGCFNL